MLPGKLLFPTSSNLNPFIGTLNSLWLGFRIVSHTKWSVKAPNPNPIDTKIHKIGEMTRKQKVVKHKQLAPYRFDWLSSLAIIPMKTANEYSNNNTIIRKVNPWIPLWTKVNFSSIWGQVPFLKSSTLGPTLSKKSARNSWILWARKWKECYIEC